MLQTHKDYPAVSASTAGNLSLLRFITCGSVDDGKSTLIGHILYDAKLLYADQEQALILDSQVGSRSGAIDYSLLLDGLMAEREQGITIDAAYRYFTTESRSFIVADTPGHEEYTRNMAVGASFADLAVILVDATQGVLPQTRRHARICGMMGIRHFVFAVNKMDLAQYNEDVFGTIKQQINELSLQLSLENIIAIPISATEGDNVTRPSIHTPWYIGPALLRYLETVDVSPHGGECGFYMPVQRVCRPDHTFRGFQGQVECGVVSVGDMLTAMPSGEACVVKIIHIGDKAAQSAEAGQPITIQLDREVDVSRGCVLTRDAALQISSRVTASLLWMDDAPLSPGREYWLKVGSQLRTCVIDRISYCVDINTGEHIHSQTVNKNGIAICDIHLPGAAVVDTFANHRALGELILIDRVTHATSACGVIERVHQREHGGTLFEHNGRRSAVAIFDSFVYHRDVSTVRRYSPPDAVYQAGDALPLVGSGYHYPSDFDIMSRDGCLRVRGGCFSGFASRDESYPLIDVNGFGVDEPFERYRTIVMHPSPDAGADCDSASI